MFCFTKITRLQKYNFLYKFFSMYLAFYSKNKASSGKNNSQYQMLYSRLQQKIAFVCIFGEMNKTRLKEMWYFHLLLYSFFFTRDTFLSYRNAERSMFLELFSLLLLFYDGIDRHATRRVVGPKFLIKFYTETFYAYILERYSQCSIPPRILSAKSFRVRCRERRSRLHHLSKCFRTATLAHEAHCKL